ncbi:MAG: hypothetical protein IPK75_18425 [Acidobacteria bacterium]|nr:hypothetical protein [Acidobacteriota bacterium]
MASTDARPVPQKNVAYRITFPIFDADGDLVTGATGLDSEVSKDGGTFTDCTNEATEIATNSGMYYLDLTSTEMNADTVAVIIKTSSSGAKTTPIVMYPEEAGDIRVNVTAFGGTAGTFASGRPEVNTTHLAGTSQTGRDIGASVLLSPGTGTGQISLSSGAVTAGTVSDKTGYALSSGGVQAIWDALTSALSTASSIGKHLVDNVNATISSRASQASVDTVDTVVDAIQAKTNNLPASPAAVGSAMTLAADALNASALAADAVAEIQSGLSTLTAAGVRTAVGLASANLDTQLDALPTAAENANAVWDEARSGHATAGTFGEGVASVTGAVASVTAGVTVTTNNDKTGYALTSGERTSIAEALLKLDLSTVTGEAARSVLNAVRFLRNKWSISGTTLTVTKEDDLTSAWTATVTTNASADPVTGSDPA